MLNRVAESKMWWTMLENRSVLVLMQEELAYVTAYVSFAKCVEGHPSTRYADVFGQGCCQNNDANKGGAANRHTNEAGAG